MAIDLSLGVVSLDDAYAQKVVFLERKVSNEITLCSDRTEDGEFPSSFINIMFRKQVFIKILQDATSLPCSFSYKIKIYDYAQQLLGIIERDVSINEASVFYLPEDSTQALTCLLFDNQMYGASYLKIRIFSIVGSLTASLFLG